jgi:hypothetical protein
MSQFRLLQDDEARCVDRTYRSTEKIGSGGLAQGKDRHTGMHQEVPFEQRIYSGYNDRLGNRRLSDSPVPSTYPSRFSWTDGADRRQNIVADRSVLDNCRKCIPAQSMTTLEI